MKSTLQKWGAPVSLRELGIRQNEIKLIADNAWMTAPLGRLKSLTRQDVETILRLSY
jgi:alcohol dehydrogenase YqhD (iron-dependent ADH family)